MVKTTKPPDGGTQTVAPYDYSQAGVTGFENTTQQDFGIPFLQILQKGSPQIDEAHPEHASKKIKGAKVGDIINTLSNAVVWGKSSPTVMQFVPCSYEKLYVEWIPREKGGGMVKVHRNAQILLECTRNEKNQNVLRSGNLVIDTAYFYGLLLQDGQDPLPCVLGMTSTQLKKARMWLNMMSALKLNNMAGQKYTPPMFSHQYAITTVPENNEKGNWYGWQIRMGGIITDRTIIDKALDTAKTSFTGRAALPAPGQDSVEEHM
ncbi:hypothetical protein EPO05_06490 [Patescibacteria group bacterium]|nr:MAG: hypothetical protein EPO05_06490 [Patescibacteria group bacterium]